MATVEIRKYGDRTRLSFHQDGEIPRDFSISINGDVYKQCLQYLQHPDLHKDTMEPALRYVSLFVIPIIYSSSEETPELNQIIKNDPLFKIARDLVRQKTLEEATRSHPK